MRQRHEIPAGTRQRTIVPATLTAEKNERSVESVREIRLGKNQFCRGQGQTHGR